MWSLDLDIVRVCIPSLYDCRKLFHLGKVTIPLSVRERTWFQVTSRMTHLQKHWKIAGQKGQHIITFPPWMLFLNTRSDSSWGRLGVHTTGYMSIQPIKLVEECEKFIYSMKSLFHICLKLPAGSEHQIFVPSAFHIALSHEEVLLISAWGIWNSLGGERCSFYYSSFLFNQFISMEKLLLMQ